MVFYRYAKQGVFMSLRETLSTGISFRLIIIGFLLLVFMIPTGMVSSLTHERERNSYHVIDEIASKWGGAQQIIGPILMVPYVHHQKTYEKDKDGNTIEHVAQHMQRAYFLPEKLSIKGFVSPQKRHRNIYEAVVYKSDLSFNGTFKVDDFRKWGINTKDIRLKDARVLFALSDARGIKEQVSLTFNKQTQAFEAGTLNELLPLFQGGIQARVDALRENTFSFHVVLNGSKSIMFSPFGKTTDVTLSSSWKDPSFTGAFLPDTQKISDEGFSASWHVLDLNRGYPQSFLGDEIKMLSGARMRPPVVAYSEYMPKIRPTMMRGDYGHINFGVEFHMMVDYYQKSERAVKYAMLFLSLTFLLFFFVEVFNKRKIHPFAYILVGLSLVLFFVLLLSFSEYVGFNYAYVIATVATISSIALYAKSIFKNTKFVYILFSLLVLLYAFMFTLLQLDGYALLIGSVMLFAVLSVVMYVSRDIDWYNTHTTDELSNTTID